MLKMLLKGASLLGKEAPPQKAAGDDRQCAETEGWDSWDCPVSGQQLILVGAFQLKMLHDSMIQKVAFPIPGRSKV